MEFERDEAKRWSNLAKHRIDFARVRLMFDGRFLVTVPSRVLVAFMTEERFVTTGMLRRPDGHGSVDRSR